MLRAGARGRRALVVADRVRVGRLGPHRELGALGLDLVREALRRARRIAGTLRGFQRSSGSTAWSTRPTLSGGELGAGARDRGDAQDAVEGERREEGGGPEARVGGRGVRSRAARICCAARTRSAAPTAKRTETPRSPTRSPSCTNAGQGLTRPAGLHTKIAGSERATRMPAPKAISRQGARARLRAKDRRDARAEGPHERLARGQEGQREVRDRGAERGEALDHGGHEAEADEARGRSPRRAVAERAQEPGRIRPGLAVPDRRGEEREADDHGGVEVGRGRGEREDDPAEHGEDQRAMAAEELHPREV